MGAMKDMQIELMTLEFEWGEFLAKFIEDTGMGNVTGEYCLSDHDIEETYHHQILNQPDLLFKPFGRTDLVPVELRIYRWHSDWVEMTINSARHLEGIMSAHNYKRGILVLTQDLTTSRTFSKNDLKLPEGIELWDLADLWERSEGHPQIQARLEELAAETVLNGHAIPYKPTSIEKTPLVEGEGAKLAKNIRRVPPGKEGANAFENLCEDSLKYLFNKDIINWKRQNSTRDKLNRMDLIGRVQPNSGTFWNDISRDFGTRYIVFEAKNYSAKIGQGEILTTEKYLFPKALRSVALIIARNGASESALKTIEGALRDQGKLILVLSMEELCTLLEGFDEGIAPENLLYDKMDFLLMEVGR